MLTLLRLDGTYMEPKKCGRVVAMAMTVGVAEQAIGACTSLRPTGFVNSVTATSV